MATEYFGAKWGDGSFGTSGGTVTYSFALPTTSTYYSYTAELSSEYQALVTAAFDQWEHYADIDFVFTADTASADIILGWDRIDGFGSIVGETTFWSNPRTDEMSWAEIRFDTAEDWTLDNNGLQSWETDFYSVALHEIGHAIGLDHTSVANSIMYPVTGYVFDLTQTDITGIQALYGPADGVSGPGWASSTFDFGGWNYGWYRDGGFDLGWHTEIGWDLGWFSESGGWTFGWSFHAGWEFGWYGTGNWAYGWYFDYGGLGWGGSNIGWQNYGWWGGNYGHEGWGWPPRVASWYFGASFDLGGWNYGWYEQGGWGWGWHLEGGWDHGWYQTANGWAFGWFIHEGWELGWYGTGSWAYGWYHDYGGQGFGWTVGWESYGWTDGFAGNESYI